MIWGYPLYYITQLYDKPVYNEKQWGMWNSRSESSFVNLRGIKGYLSNATPPQEIAGLVKGIINHHHDSLITRG